MTNLAHLSINWRKQIIKCFVVICTSVLVTLCTNAQVGIGTNKPDSSAAIDITDTARGLLVPRMTFQQRLVLKNPAEGLMVYQTDSAGGFWYYRNGQWRNMTPPNNGGRYKIQLSGPISNIQAQAKLAAEYGPNTQVIQISHCTNLTAIDLSMVKSISEIYISGNPVLETADLSKLGLVEIILSIESCPVLKNLGFDSLEEIVQGTDAPAFSIKGIGLQHLNFPALKKITGKIVIGSSDIYSPEGNPDLLSATFPALEDCGPDGVIEIRYNHKLSTLSFPVLKKARHLLIESNNVLGSFSAPAVTTIETVTFQYNGSLATAPYSFSFPSLLTVDSLNISSNGNYQEPSNSLVSISFPSLLNADRLYLTGNRSLPSLSFPVLVNAHRLTIWGNDSLTSISFPVLPIVGDFDIVENQSLNTVSLPLAHDIGSLVIENSGSSQFKSLSLPLTTTAGKIQVRDRGFMSLSLPVLTSAGKLYIKSNAVSAFSAPALTTAGVFSVLGWASDDMNTGLTSLSVPALTGLTEPNETSEIAYCANLVSVSLPNLAVFKNQKFNLKNKFTSTQVNAFLAKFVSMTPALTGKIFVLNQEIYSPPTGQGIIDKATLEARSNFVLTN